MIAQDLGYVGFAADLFGPDLQEDIPIDTRMELAGMYRSNVTLFASRIQAAVDALQAMPDRVEGDKIAVIGYCFGGTGIIAYTLLGGDGVVGSMSFHGGLVEFPSGIPAQHPILIFSGGDDDTSTEVQDLEDALNSSNATWEITRYANIQHAFTVWDDDRYNELADSRSWDSMEQFLKERFGEEEHGTVQPTAISVQPVDYKDGDFDLRGYVSVPDETVQADASIPAVVILPNWDNVNRFEKERATQLADFGYVGFAADIFGADLQNETLNRNISIAQTSMYRDDKELFVSRIQAAVDTVKNLPQVDPTKIAIIGYCFGGTGAIDYAIAGKTDAKAVIPFHGGLTDVPTQTFAGSPAYVLILSGGVDDAFGNNTELEEALNNANATWEITRYSNVQHGFTSWGSSAYDARADSRSFDSMLSILEMVFEDDNNSTDGGPTSDDPTAAPGGGSDSTSTSSAHRSRVVDSWLAAVVILSQLINVGVSVEFM